VDLPIDQSGALYLVEWSTSEGHVYNLVLRDGASGQLAASVPSRRSRTRAGSCWSAIAWTEAAQTSRIAVTPTTTMTTVTVTIDRRSFAPAVATTSPHFTRVFARAATTSAPRRCRGAPPAAGEARHREGDRVHVGEAGESGDQVVAPAREVPLDGGHHDQDGREQQAELDGGGQTERVS